jgi:phenylpropionate dioxygenase-like ring-hydroxylating dioxygenase large terminal subunit
LPVLAFGGGVSSDAELAQDWYFLCRSEELGDEPRRFELRGIPLVLFRDGQGRAHALLDRCPHRNVPLSGGRVHQGQLECPYHGWRFDGEGHCRAVPGLCDEAPEQPARRAGPYALRELQGLIWVWGTPDEPPTRDPHHLPFLGAPGYLCVIESFEVEATVHALAENTLDVPHTAFLHGGLFRKPGKVSEIEVEIYRGDEFVEARFIGEDRPEGLIGRLLAPGGGEVEHTDRFWLPSICEVDYRLSERSHINVRSLITPLSAERSRLTAVLCLKLPIPGWVLRPLVQPIARKIFAQDIEILSAQSEAIERFGGERYVSTPIDALGPEILRLLRRAERGERSSRELEFVRRFRLAL